MNTICLVQGGGFLIGINDADIASRMTAGTVPSAGRVRTADLGALLACRPGRTAPPDSPCLELRGQDETFFLLVDRIEGEVEAAAPPAPLPSACPALTARLCPQTGVCGAAAVPILDPAQVIPVCALLGKGIGLIPEEEPERLEETAAEQTELEERAWAVAVEEPTNGQESLFSPPEEPLLTEEAEPAARQAAHDRDELFSGLEEESASPKAEDEPEPTAAEQEQPGKSSDSIDEHTFKEVMSWTVARFKQGCAEYLGVEHLPPELAARVRQKGLDRNVIQYLIDQIVLRCQESVQRKKPGEQHGG
jgi:hypothetical protein